MREKPKLSFFAKFPLLRNIQTFSHTLLVRQTSDHNHCNCHAPKPGCMDFQVISSSSSWSKTNGLIFHMCSILDVPIPITQVLGLYIQMFLSYWLYVCIILHLKKNSQKMFHISSLILPFPYGKVMDIFGGIRINFIWEWQKEEIRGGYG